LVDIVGAGRQVIRFRFVDLLPDFLSIYLYEKHQLCYCVFTPFR